MGSASYTKGAKRVGGGNHEWVGMNREIHERREREIQSHEWTRMARRGNSEPRMDTKYTKGKFRTTNGHEWARMGNSEPRMDTNGRERKTQNHEWTRMARRGNSEPRMDTNGHERKTQNHEWTRMDTNRWEGTTKHTKYTKGKLRATNGHEWNHEIQEWNHETHEKHEKRQGG